MGRYLIVYSQGQSFDNSHRSAGGVVHESSDSSSPYLDRL